MKRPTRESLSAAANTGFPDPDFSTRYKTIAEYLSCGVWEDGKARELSSLTVCLGGSGIQVALNDKALSRSAYSTAGTLAEALELLDGALLEGTVGWRPWRNGQKPGK
jgi:hypothetical protein